MSRQEREFLDAALRTSFLTFQHRVFLTLNPGAEFIPNWHHEAIAYQLDRVFKGEVTRLIINLPPRFLKSMTVTVAFTAFLLGHFPTLRVFGISYGEELADEHAAQFRTIVESEWYGRAFPKMQIARVADSDVYTTDRGFRKATSINASLTGMGGDVFVIDDPLKPTDAMSDANRNKVNDWYSSTLLSRLDDKATGVIIVVMQRVHEQDLTGHLLETSDEWTHLKLPAIADDDEQISVGANRVHVRRAGEALHPQRESLEYLKRLRRQVGTDVFAAQYQQSPVPPGGTMIQRSWVKYYDAPPDITKNSTIIQSWDTASKTGSTNSYSVCTTWVRVGKVYYLLDITRGRFEFPELREQAIRLAKEYKPSKILIEDTSTGTALVQELIKAKINSARPIKPQGDKADRLFVQQNKFAQGQVLFPKSAPFLQELLDELLSFPQGRTDDIVDSITQALAYEIDDNEYDDSLDWVGDASDIKFCAPRLPPLAWMMMNSRSKK